MSNDKPFHLAWFMSQGYGPKAWHSQWPGTETDGSSIPTSHCR